MDKTWPKPLTGKLCFFHASIQSMRRSGYVWEQIKDALIHAGVCPQETSTGQIRSAWIKTLKGIEAGRLVAGDCQLEIMPLGSKHKPEREQKTEDSATSATNRPLPVDPSKPRKMGSGSDEERFAKLRAMGIDTSSMEKE